MYVCMYVCVYIYIYIYIYVGLVEQRRRDERLPRGNDRLPQIIVSSIWEDIFYTPPPPEREF